MSSTYLTPQNHQSTPESEDNDHSPSPPAVTRDLTATTSANLTTSCHSSPAGSRTKHRVSFSTLGDDGRSQPFSQLTAPYPQGSTITFPFGGFATPSLDHSLLNNTDQSPLLSLFGNSIASSLQTAVTTTSDTISSHSPKIFTGGTAPPFRAPFVASTRSIFTATLSSVSLAPSHMDAAHSSLPLTPGHAAVSHPSVSLASGHVDTSHSSLPLTPGYAAVSHPSVSLAPSHMDITHSWLPSTPGHAVVTHRCHLPQVMQLSLIVATYPRSCICLSSFSFTCSRPRGCLSLAPCHMDITHS